MSDLHDENQLQGTPEQGENAPAEQTENMTGDQETRVVPAVNSELGRQLPRRRRSSVSRPADDDELAQRVRGETHVNPSPRPSQTVPRPGALNRLTRDDVELEDQPEQVQTRRPVNAPGYMKRRPLGQTATEPEQPEQTNYADDEMTEEELLAFRNNPRRNMNTGVRRPIAPTASNEAAREVAGDELPQKSQLPRRLESREAMNYDELVEQDSVDEAPRKPVNKLLVAIIAVVLVIALAVMGLLLVPNSDTGMLGTIKRSLTGAEMPSAAPKAAVMDFTVALNEGTAPMNVQFTLTTNKYADSVRVVDDNGNPLSATPIRIDNTDTIIWILNATVKDPYTGRVQAQAQEGDQWIASNRTLSLQISAALTATGTPVPTVVPATAAPEETDEPAMVIEETPVPTAEPTQEPEPTPTMMVTPLPTMVPADDFEEIVVDDVDEEPVAAGFDAAPVTGDDEDYGADLMDEDEEDPFFLELDDEDGYVEEPIDEDEFIDEEVIDEDEEPIVIEVTEPEEVDDLAGEEDVGSLPLPEPTAEPAVTEAPRMLTAEACKAADPALIANVAVYSNSGKKLTSYSRDIDDVLKLPVGDAYLTMPFGVLTFRGNASRQNASVGKVGETLDDMSILWTVETGRIKSSGGDYYYGVDWTGQAAIVKWPKEVRAASNMKDAKKEKTGLREVIVAANDGNIYFLDLENGESTRTALDVGYPMHGTPSIHPLGFPLMTVGQFARKMAGNANGSIGLRFYNLLNQKQMFMINGIDKAYNPPYSVGSFETSALYDASADAMVSVGTNGVLYLADLNTKFDKNAVELTIKPELTAMTATIKKQTAKNAAVESSMAMYGSYVFYADMQGILRCVDTTTMTVIWAVDTGDSVEAAIALDMDDNGDLWLYTANELNNRAKGDSTVCCYNAMSGELAWETGLTVSKKNDKNKAVSYTVGVKASPVIGQNGLDDLVYFTVSGLSKAAAAELGLEEKYTASALLAMDKITGEVAWVMDMEAYTYSSPVAVYNENGKGWIVQACSNGHVYLLDGLTGEIVNELTIDGTVHASPAVYGNIMVLSTTGKNTSYIYGIVLD